MTLNSKRGNFQVENENLQLEKVFPKKNKFKILKSLLYDY